MLQNKETYLPILSQEKSQPNQILYKTFTMPNWPTFSYRSDLSLEDHYKENKTFVLRSKTIDSLQISLIDGYTKGSDRYIRTEKFGNNSFILVEACGDDTCQEEWILIGPNNNKALVLEGDISLIDATSVTFN
jgi:hypothetical protein